MIHNDSPNNVNIIEDDLKIVLIKGYLNLLEFKRGTLSFRCLLTVQFITKDAF